MFAVYDVDGARAGRRRLLRLQLAVQAAAAGMSIRVVSCSNTLPAPCAALACAAHQPPYSLLPAPPAAPFLSPSLPPCPGDGAISEEDLEIVLRQLAGSSLAAGELRSIIAKVLRGAAASERGLTFPEYKAALEGVELDLHVEVPLED